MIETPSPTVLIVDDDEAKRYSIAKILLRAGFRIREVTTGSEALRLSLEQPDLIILDVKLPDISGFEVCRRIKADPTTASIPVLHISTTFVDIEDKVQGLEGGADGYLTDVLEPLELIATVRALLRTRRAEEAAHISSKQWQITFDAINDGVVLLDRAGRVLQSNRAMERILGRPWSDLAGRDIHDIVAIASTPTSSPFLRMLDNRQRESADLTLGDRWIHVAIDPIRDDGVIKGALCIASDITDRRRMEEELRRRADELSLADRRKDEFLAMLAHELRNPLAPIRSALQVIRLEQHDNSVKEESLAIAERQVAHMAHLLDDLLDVARFTRGNVQLQSVPVDLASILVHAIETSRPMIEAEGHVLTASLPSEPIQLMGDPTRLSQVVANLLNNAAKYTPRGGRIALSATREGDEIVLSVRDNGIGMTAEMLSRVFDLFAQADLSLDRSRGGLGIGLTLVRSLVELHGGSIAAHSEGLGQGSEFVVRLSIPSYLPPSVTQPSMPAPDLLGNSLSLLVVDDSRDSARSLARVLKLWGHEVHIAHDGPEAIEVASARSFDVILLDIGLPEMDGYQVAERIRKQSRVPKSTLIALTGYGQQEDLRRSKDAGFDHHLIKPLVFDELKELLSLRQRARPEHTP